MLFNNTNMRTAMAYTNAVGDKVYPIIVDIKKGIKSTEEVSFVSSDINTGVLSVAFIQGNDTYNVEGAEVICSIMRPDTTTLEIPCNAVNGNTIEVPLGVNGTSQDGVYSFDFKVFKGGDKIVGTPIMNYSVSLSISNDLVVEEDDRLPVLTMLITQVNELKEETRETINQANVATEASKEATANAIEATDNANAVSERVSQETSEAISRVDNTIVELNNTVSEKVSELDNAKSDMTTTVSNKVNEVETRFNALTTSQQQDAEVIDARDGETSLKARLDRDIEKAKQVYVELEGNHISTESSTGAIQDLEIKGNTVQDPNNLADIKSVGVLQEDGTYKMSILSCGKNLFDGEIELGGYDWSNGVKYTATDRIRCKNQFISIKPNTKYVSNQSIAYVWYDNAKQFIKSDVSYTTNPIQSPKNAYYVNIVAYTTDLTINIALYESDLPVSVYEPYQENKCDILLPCQLEKVGDVSDRLYYDDVEKAWCIEKNVGIKQKVNIENMTFRKTLNNGLNRFSFTDSDISIKSTSENTLNIISSVTSLPSLSVWGNETGKGLCTHISTSTIYYTTETKDLEIAKKELENLQLVYQLATPQKIVLPLSTQIQLNSFFGTTHVYMESGEVEGTIKCKIPKSLGATVQSLNNKTDILSDRIEAIEGLKDSQNMKYETDKGYLVCKETKNGVIDDLKIEGKTLVNLFRFKDYKIMNEVNLYAVCLDTKDNNITSNRTFTFRNTTSRQLTLDISENGTWKRSVILHANKQVVVTTTPTEYVSYIYGAGSSGWDVNSEAHKQELKNACVLLEGDHTQNPPSYFEGLMSVGEDVDEIEVLSRKEDGNLFAIDNCKYLNLVEKGDILISEVNKSVFGVNVAPDSRPISNLHLKGGYTYTLSFDVVLNSGTKITNGYVCTDYTNYPTSVQQTITGKTRISLIMTPTNDLTKVGFVFYTNSDTSAQVSNISLYKHSETEYIPHQSDKKQILFYNENGELEPVTELHEWDSIEKHSDNKWYYHKRSGKVVLNGSENWNIVHLELDNTHRLGTNKLINCMKPNCTVICDKFTQQTDNQQYNNDIEGISTNAASNLYIRISKSKLSTQDAEGFKQWLQTNNVTVIYQLAEEEIYELAPLHLDSYANETLILCNSGAISPKMEFSITSHINELIKSQGDRISLLEEKMYKALKQVLAGDMYSLAELLYPEDFVEENPENEIMLLPFE